MPLHLKTSIIAGSRFDTIPGTAHFLEHMLVAGTQRFPSKNLIAEHIQKVGGDFGASTNPDILRLWLEVAESQDLHTGIEILSECLTKSTFEQKTIENERGAIFSELKSWKTNPKEYIFDVSRRLTFQKTPIGGGVLGSEEGVKSIQKDTMLTHLGACIHSGRIAFVASGDIDIDVLTDELNSIEINTGERFKTSAPLPIFSEKKTDLELYPGVTQLQVILSCRIMVDSYKEYCALKVINQILSSGRGSRLATKLRYENGLIYTVAGNVTSSIDWGSLGIKLSCDKNNYEKTIRLIFEEFDNLNKNNISSVELENTKSRISKGQIRSLQTSESWARFHEEYCLFNPDEVKTVEDYIETVQELSLDDIAGVITKYLDKNNFFTAICGEK